MSPPAPSDALHLNETYVFVPPHVEVNGDPHDELSLCRISNEPNVNPFVISICSPQNRMDKKNFLDRDNAVDRMNISQPDPLDAPSHPLKVATRVRIPLGLHRIFARMPSSEAFYFYRSHTSVPVDLRNSPILSHR